MQPYPPFCEWQCWQMCAYCSLLWFQITFWQLQLDRHRLKMSKVAERWAMCFVSLFSLAIDLFIEPLNGLTRRGIKNSDDLEVWLSPDIAFSGHQHWKCQILDGTQNVHLSIPTLKREEVHSESSLSLCPNAGSIPPVSLYLFLFQFKVFDPKRISFLLFSLVFLLLFSICS